MECKGQNNFGVREKERGTVKLSLFFMMSLKLSGKYLKGAFCKSMPRPQRRGLVWEHRFGIMGMVIHYIARVPAPIQGLVMICGLLGTRPHSRR